MGHYANVVGGVVVQVIVAEEEFVNTLPGVWVQTSYNTRGGVHYGSDGQPDGREAWRKNYAGIGYMYYPEWDAFIPPPPWLSWVLNRETCLWEAPVPYPTDGNEYTWNELTREWVLFVRTT